METSVLAPVYPALVESDGIMPLLSFAFARSAIETTEILSEARP